MLESVYAQCLAHELTIRGVTLQREWLVPVTYKDAWLDATCRVDMVVEGRLIIEVKAVERLLPVHSAQLLTYLRLSRISVGLLVNFNAALLKHGLRRLTMPTL